MIILGKEIREAIEINFKIMSNIFLILNKMASIAIMTGGAIINVTALVGGSYLARYWSGGSEAEEDKKRHDLCCRKI